MRERAQGEQIGKVNIEICDRGRSYRDKEQRIMEEVSVFMAELVGAPPESMQDKIRIRKQGENHGNRHGRPAERQGRKPAQCGFAPQTSEVL